MRLLLGALFVMTVLTGARAEPLSVAAWNVETFHFFGTCTKLNARKRCIGGNETSSGSSSALTAVALRDDFNGFDIMAFSEVIGEPEAETFAVMADQDEDANYRHIIGKSGRNIHVAMIYADKRLELLEWGNWILPAHLVAVGSRWQENLRCGRVVRSSGLLPFT